MGLLKNDYPMVGFRYEVNIVPDMGANKSNLTSKDGRSGIMDTLKSSTGIAALASSSVSAADKASFSEISGVTVTLESETYNTDNKTKELVRGTKFSPLVLKRGLTGTQSQLMAWVIASLLSGESKPVIITKTVIVTLLSDQGAPLMCWVFNGAYPTKWSMSGLKAMSNELVIEELELKYDYFYPMILGI